MSVSQFVRGKVSKSKRRYVDKKNNFDLDLSYIVEGRIIAMGFPSEGMEAQYRNPYTEVYRFLELCHSNHYKLYNLCSERGYDSAKFHDRVGLFPFDDHNPPPFQMLDEFCRDVKSYLDEDPQNVAVIHCKAGKGRTGTVICSYMLFEQRWATTDESMTFYAAMRTYNRKGVTIPSQIRYIRYYEHFLKHGMPPARTLMVHQVVLHGVPKVPSKALELQIMESLKNVVHTQEEKVEKQPRSKKQKGELDAFAFEVNPPVPVAGDIKMELAEKQVGFTFSFNTAFVASQWKPEGPYHLVIPQCDLDKALKDKQNKVYPKGFHVEVIFTMREADLADQAAVYAQHVTNASGAISALSVPVSEVGEGECAAEDAAAVTAEPAVARYSELLYKYPSLSAY